MIHSGNKFLLSLDNSTKCQRIIPPRRHKFLKRSPHYPRGYGAEKKVNFGRSNDSSVIHESITALTPL
jgi:hypothetical protein